MVRDATKFDGFVLDVKTRNMVIHVKIFRRSDGTVQVENFRESVDATYQTASTKQPRFDKLPIMIEYYSEPHDNVPFILKKGDDSYDNSRLLYGQARAISTGVHNKYKVDPNAPEVPPKTTAAYAEPCAYSSIHEESSKDQDAANPLYSTGAEHDCGRSIVNHTYESTALSESDCTNGGMKITSF